MFYASCIEYSFPLTVLFLSRNNELRLLIFSHKKFNSTQTEMKGNIEKKILPRGNRCKEN